MIQRLKSHEIKPQQYINLTRYMRKKYETKAEWLRVTDIRKDGTFIVLVTHVENIYVGSTDDLLVYTIRPDRDLVEFIKIESDYTRQRLQMYNENLINYGKGSVIVGDYIIPRDEIELYK